MNRIAKVVHIVATIGTLFAVGPGCSIPRINSGVIQVSPGTYMISTSGHFTTDLATLKEVVFRDANAFAKTQNKVMIPISTKEVERTMSQNPAFELQFRLAGPEDTSSAAVHLAPRPDVVIEKTVKISADIRNVEEKKPDLYTELMKLDDLRKKGVITEEEFIAQKKRLLEK